MSNYIKDSADYWDRVPADLEGLRSTATAEGIRISMHVIGKENDAQAPVAIVVKFKPDQAIPRHAHVGHRFEIVLEGTIKFGDQWLCPGDIMTASEQEAYGPLWAGPDGATTLEIFSVRAGVHKVWYDVGDGLKFVDALDPAAASAAIADFMKRPESC